MMQTRQISIDNWRQITADGMPLAVNIPLYGNSMLPLIRKQKDIVTILPVNRALRKGDIVLFQRADSTYVVHRIISVFDNFVQTLGDNAKTPDAPLTLDCIIGIVTHVHRGKRTIHVDTCLWRFIGRVWSFMLPIRNFVSVCCALIRKTGCLLIGGKYK